MALDSSKMIAIFLAVHIRLLNRCKLCLTLGLFENHFSVKSLGLPLKSHMDVPWLNLNIYIFSIY